MNQRMIERMSSALYVGLCDKVGTPTIIQIRRDVQDAVEIVRKESGIIFQMVLSGSRREGLRMSGSDEDFMIWQTDCRVTFGASNTNFDTDNINSSKKEIKILAVPVEEQPGFFLLRLITNPLRKSSKGPLIMIHSDIYISSSMCREEFFIQNKKVADHLFLHGPCISYKLGNSDADIAFCIPCSEWPTVAAPWIERCERKGWPSRQIVNDIVSNGCHFVPIGAKNSFFEQHEWRLSFSIAEKILLTSISHTQFLCYAMLKLFLKEVINTHTTTHLICSYFLKTVLFWELQENILSVWMPCHLLMCFWKCFKHLVHWVYKGDCPNFFIPGNNMFRGKITGAAQTQLFADLYKVYNMGIFSLLLSPSIRCYLVLVIQNPTMVIDTSEININWFLDKEVFESLPTAPLLTCSKDFNFYNCLSLLVTIRRTKRSSMTEYKALTFQRLTSQTLQFAAFLLIKNSYIPNRQMYMRDKISCGMLKLAARFGGISDLLYLAMYYYKTQRYIKGLQCVEITKERLSHLYVIHAGELDARNIAAYEEIVKYLSFTRKMKNAWSFSIQLPHLANYINILKVERHFTFNFFLVIPSYVMVSILSFICQHGNPQKQDEALFDLHYLLLYDNDCYVPEEYRDIAWQLLGICHQLRGNLYEALYSYQQSLKCLPYHGIQKASKDRILSVITELSLRN